MSLGLDSDDDAFSKWVDRMPLGTQPSVHPLGVDAIFWTNAAGQEEEHVCYIGSDNRIYDWRLVNGVAVAASYISFAAPSGETFTGRVAIGRHLDQVILFSTTTAGILYAYKVTSWAAAPTALSIVNVGSVSTSTMITTSVPASGAYVRVFFSKTDNTVWEYKWTGSSPWLTTSFAGPGGTAAPCALLSATEGDLGTVGHRTYLFCTRTGGSPHDTTLYFKYAGGPGGSAYGAWNTRTVPAGAIASSGSGLTARRRAGQAGSTLEAFFLGTAVTNRYFHIEHTFGAANIAAQITDLGRDDETTASAGGVAAAGRASRGYSDLFYIGQSDQAMWLYRKINDLNGDGDEWLWVNYGSGRSWKVYRLGSQNSASPTESSTSILGGKVIIAAIYKRTASGESGNRITYSDDEGDTFTNPTSIPTPPAPPSWLPNGAFWSYGFDPVIDFDKQGIAYFVELRRTKFPSPSDPNTDIDGGRGLLLWTTTNGTNINFEMELDGRMTESIDHPWLVVYRNPDGVDELHVVWVIEGGDFFYTHASVNNLPDLLNNIEAIDPGGAAASIPRIVISGSRWDPPAYIVWPHGICRLTPEVDGECEAKLLWGDEYTSDHANSENGGSELQFNGTSHTFRSTRNFGAVADPEIKDWVYYTFMKREDGVPHGEGPFDVYVARMSYIGANNSIVPSARIRLNANEDNGAHQTLPEVTFTNGGGDGNHPVLYATWYDWDDVTCTVGGVLWSNRCYMVRAARSFDSSVSWHTASIFFPTISDPARFPRLSVTNTPDSRFAGDYRSVTGDLLHSAHLAITVPYTQTTDELTNIERGWASDGYFVD